MKKLFPLLFIEAFLLLLPLQAAHAHTFSYNESASFLALIEQIRAETQLVEKNLSSQDVAAQHAEYAIQLLDDNVKKEILERNNRIGTDLPAALQDLKELATGGSVSSVSQKVKEIDDLLGEAVTVRIEKEQLSDPTVQSTSFSIIINSLLDHYYKAIPREVPQDTSESSAPIEGMTNGGSYKIQVSWSPPEIRAEQANVYTVKFFDNAGKQLDKVRYDFMFMPADNPEVMIIHRGSQSASGGEAQQSFTFKEKRVGQDTLRVSNINNSGEFIDFPITVLQPANSTVETKPNTILSLADYQSSQALASIAGAQFANLRDLAPEDKPEIVGELGKAIDSLKTVVDSKSPIEDVEILVHGEIHPRLQAIFNLQVVPEFPYPVMLVVASISGVIIVTRKLQTRKMF